MQRFGHFVNMTAIRPESAACILTGDFNLVGSDVEAVVQRFNSSDSWQDWQIKTTLDELPGDLLLVKGANCRGVDIPVGRSWEE